MTNDHEGDVPGSERLDITAELGHRVGREFAKYAKIGDALGAEVRRVAEMMQPPGHVLRAMTPRAEAPVPALLEQIAAGAAPVRRADFDALRDGHQIAAARTERVVDRLARRIGELEETLASQAEALGVLVLLLAQERFNQN